MAQAGVRRPESASDSAHVAVEEGRQRDGAAEFDTKRPRVEGAARGGGQQYYQQHPSDPPAVNHVASVRIAERSCSSVVLTCPELLLHIMGYVGGGRGALEFRRKELGKLALVCRAWRAAAQHEGL